MKQQIISITPEVSSQLAQMNQSVTAWSIKYQDVLSQLRGIESTVSGIKEAREKLVRDAVVISGINPDHLKGIQVVGDGSQLACTVLDENDLNSMLGQSGVVENPTR